MKNAKRFTALIALTVVTFTTPALATQGVSPGAADRMAVVNNTCPTFSWEAGETAALYEIVAYAIHENDEPASSDLTAETEALYTRVPGGATSWTPSAAQCVAPGGRYVWFVRAVTELADDQVIEAGEWSAGRYFTVLAGPSAEEVQRAIEVLKRWEAMSSAGEATMSSATATATATETFTDTATSSAAPKSVPTASAAIRGTNPEVDIEAYGVVGTTNSVCGAGVAAANTEGGPDLVLDGSFDGATDTVLAEWGIARSSGSDEHFQIVNSGGGAMILDVFGTVAAADLDCPGCIGPSELANESVSSAAIEDDGVTEVDIAPSAVNTAHIFDGTIQAQDLAVDAVSGAAITDGSITTADLADGAVTGANIQDGAVFTNKLAEGAVSTEKIANGAVGAAQIGFESIGESELADEAVTNGKIASGAVDGLSLADNSVTGSKIAEGAVNSSDLRANAVTNTHLADDAVTGVEIVDGSVTMDDLAAESVGSDEIENGGIQAVDIGVSVIGTGHLVPDAVTSDRIAPGAVEIADLHEGSVNTLKIVDGTIIAVDLADGAVTSSKVADGTLNAADVDPAGGIYASKSAVYAVVNSGPVNPGTCGSIQARCNDGNDLPLQGTCGQYSSMPMTILSWVAEFWDDPSQQAGWTCEVCYGPTGSFARDIFSTIYCVSVPGP